MAECVRCGALKLTEYSCPQCGGRNNRQEPTSGSKARRFIKLGPHQPKVQRQTQRMLMKARGKKAR